MAAKDKPETKAAPVRRGRKPCPEPGTNVHMWVRVSEYDRLFAGARRRRMSVSAYARRLVFLRLPQE